MSQPPDERPDDIRDGHPADASDPPLDAATERRVRGLLADARVREPMPDAVAARLDDVLAGLHADQAATGHTTGHNTGHTTGDTSEPESSNVRELRPRRRRAAAVLVAAAAVVVIGGGGVALTQAVRGSNDGSPGTASTDSQAKSGSAPTPQSIAPSSGNREQNAPPAGLPALHAATFEQDAVAILQGPRYRQQLASGQATTPPGCSVAPSPARGATSLGVLYDSGPAVMTVSPARGTHHRVTIISCESTQTVRSATVNTG